MDGTGAPRWKQRALYDAIKDMFPVTASGVSLSRVATHDRIRDVTLGAVLAGACEAKPATVRALVEARTA